MKDAHDIQCPLCNKFLKGINEYSWHVRQHIIPEGHIHLDRDGPARRRPARGPQAGGEAKGGGVSRRLRLERDHDGSCQALLVERVEGEVSSEHS